MIEDILTSDGVYVFPKPFATPKQIEEIIRLTETELQENDGSYEFGRAGRIGSVEKWKDTAIYDIFSSSSIWDIAFSFMKNEINTVPNFNEIFVTHDNRSDQGLAANGFLHFDRRPTFKFFMYLTDCDRDSGAFHYVPKTYQIGKKLRTESRNESSDYKDMKNKLEIDYPELGYTAFDSIPIEGPAGTMFAFHSDVFHMGGRISEGNERRVIRLHVRGKD